MLVPSATIAADLEQAAATKRSDSIEAAKKKIFKECTKMTNRLVVRG